MTAETANRPSAETGASDVFVRVSSLHKQFNGQAAVDSVSFDIRRGEIFGLLGPNGVTWCHSSTDEARSDAWPEI